MRIVERFSVYKTAYGSCTSVRCTFFVRNGTALQTHRTALLCGMYACTQKQRNFFFSVLPIFGKVGGGIAKGALPLPLGEPLYL